MLTIRNLSKTYDNGVHALKSISLDIEPGLFGLLGPNGAGKSSLMRTIATLQKASHGQISFDNKEQAEGFCETNTDLESKYWTYCEIIDFSERIELFYNH